MINNEIINNRKTVFFLNTKNPVSPMQKIFIDLSLHMHKNGFDVLYINKTHQCDLNARPELSDVFCDINKVDFSTLKNAVFFVPINYLFDLLLRIHILDNAKICLYMYDENDVNDLYDNMGHYLSVEKITGIIKDTDSCAFINRTLLTDSFIDDPDNAVIIPYSVFASKEIFDSLPAQNRNVNNNCLNIGYFGDITNALIPSINNLASNLAKCHIREKILLHLIGTADFIPDIDLNAIGENGASLIFPGKLSEKEQAEYAAKNIDIAFAANYEAVNIAASSTPTAIPIIDPEPFSENRYVFINDVENLDFGWDINTFSDKDYNCYTMKHLVDEVFYNNKKKQLGEKAANFVFEHCSMETATNSLLSLISRSKLDLQYFLDLREIKNLIAFYSKCKNTDDIDKFSESIKKTTSDSPVKQTENQTKTQAVSQKRFPKLSSCDNSCRNFRAIQKSYSKKIQDIKKLFAERKKIKVGFTVIFNSVFPSRPIFEIMCKTKIFDPYIIIIPNVSGSIKKQIDQLNITYNDFINKYDASRIIKAYDISNDKYLDIKDDYSILFFNNPYKELVHPYHDIEHFLNYSVLPIYIGYGFATLKFWNEIIDRDFYNFLWKACIDTRRNFNYLKKVQRLKGKNCIVTGYIKADGLAQIVPERKTRKTVLICPHHTVHGWEKLDISNFLTYSDFFTELPKLFPNIDFVFRPHPLLFPNLKNFLGWQQQQIDDYLAKLLENTNMSYDTSGDYYPQFINSDAMIHDCGSFIAEYLYTGNPCCYMMKSKEKTYDTLLPFGKKCMDWHYQAFTKEDIVDFIQNVVINNADPMKEGREKFAETELKYNFPHAAEKVVELIKKELEINEVL